VTTLETEMKRNEISSYLLPVIIKLANNVERPSQRINSKYMIVVATLYAVLREIYGHKQSFG